jgi:diaminohydroxyphosphoribosylaminopyrimidine deaminase / 5-amino-6-(5-phosphoribosylamino)uracil reductase
LSEILVKTTNEPIDAQLMSAALTLARRGLGNTSPNPAVGCILARPDMGDRVVGRGWTQPGGRPHAETEAVKRAGDLSQGATAYVTLEPCCHQGKTPPCTDALIAAGVGRVVVALEDPDPRVAGQGVAALTQAGIQVEVGMHSDEASYLNAGFIKRLTSARPHITLKTATSQDGMIASRVGHAEWITGVLARNYGHSLRARNDAIMTGMGTVRIDNPNLTCRLPGLEGASPIRVVLDPRLEIPADSNLVSTATETPTWIVTGQNGPSVSHEGVRVLTAGLNDDGTLDVTQVVSLLAEHDLNRVLLEAGGKMNAAFLRAGLVDEIYWFRAPRVIGGDGVSAIEGVCVEQLVETPAFRHTGSLKLGVDRLETYVATH